MKTKAAEPIQIGSKLVKNRVTFAPTVKFWAGDDGLADERFARHYEDRAAGGAGLICVEATCVAPDGRLAPSQLGLWNDGQVAGHAAIASACHRHGATVIVQLHHAGGVTHPATGEGYGPSAYEYRGRQCKELSAGQIQTIKRQFVEAALRARQAGYDGVQLHACHGYLINQFINPLTNRRTDGYGGDAAARARFGCELIQGIRAACGADFLISMRHSAAECTLEDGAIIAEAYVDAGADYLQLSDGIGPYEVDDPEGSPYTDVCWMGIELRRRLSGRVPVSVVNGIRTPEQARAILDDGLADTIDSAKALLADPEWARAVTDGTDYVPCRACKICLWSPMMPHRCPAATVRKQRDPGCVDIVSESASAPV